MRRHTEDDLQQDLGLLYSYEVEGLSQRELAAREGQSQPHISHRLSRARRYREELDRRDRAQEAAVTAGKDRFDFDYMELVGVGTQAQSIRWCDVDSGESNRSNGSYHVGGQIRSIQGGTITTDETGPTSYVPDPDLKGGKD